MAENIGLDWAGNGWLGIILRDDGNHDFDLFPSILSVWSNHKDADQILVDIPIGLSENGKRTCDERATEFLSPVRNNSVFSTPVRKAIYAKTLTEAKEINEEFGFSISNQAWSICLRIREVDELFDEFSEATRRVRESHPEVCFAALHGSPMEYRKSTEEGLRERKEVLFAKDESLESLYEDVIETFVEPPSWARRLSKNGKDDVLDSLVLAYTAQLSDEERTTLPEDPEKDRSKTEPLPIEIVKPK